MERLTVEGVTVTAARGRAGRPAVVFMPSAFGVATDVEQQLQELAAEANVAAAFDPFTRDDPGPAVYGDMKRVMARLGRLDRAQTWSDLCAVIRWARAEGPSKVIVVGVCFGGPFAFQTAVEGIADGVVTWHATRLENHLSSAHEIRCPLRLHFGAADPLTPEPVVEAVRAAVSGLEDARIFVHPGAVHGFTHRAANDVYSPVAEKAAMASVLDLLRS